MSDDSTEPRLEILRSQHALSGAFQQIVALCGHLGQLPDARRLRRLRGHHLADWMGKLSRSLADAAADGYQAGIADPGDFVPSVAARLADFQQAVSRLPVDMAMDLLLYADHVLRCAGDATPHGLDYHD